LYLEDVPKRKKLLKTAQKKMEGLTENEERGLGSYKLIVRTLVVLVLDAYLALLRAAEKVSCLVLLLPRVLLDPRYIASNVHTLCGASRRK
jgi:hypothetical protein